jgi:hypothetical protein
MNDLPVGRSVDETLRLVQAFQYTDEHGEVCPAGWKPGQETVSANIFDKKPHTFLYICVVLITMIFFKCTRYSKNLISCFLTKLIASNIQMYTNLIPHHTEY